MKNYLQDNFEENMSYDRLRVAVKEAWEKVGEAELEALINSIKEKLWLMLGVTLQNIKIFK